MKTFILDTYAVLCLFDRKRRSEKSAVMNYFKEAEAGVVTLYMSKINEGEVFYRLYKYLGAEIASGFRDDIKKKVVPLNVVSVNDARAEEASLMKARFAVSYADAFCIALAKEMNLPVVTGDPEFQTVKDIITVLPL